jgi:DNA-binding NarL/FixJ family response regulator
MDASKPTRVALLDEHAFVRDALARHLEGSGFGVPVQHAEPGPFLALLEQFGAEVALVEVVLRGEVQLGHLEALRQFHPTVRTLVFTGAAEPGIADRCFQAGAAGLLPRLTTTGEGLVQGLRAVAAGQNVFPSEFIAGMFDSRPQRPPEASRLQALSAREREILGHIGEGADNLKIASMLGISERTVKAHVSNLYRKLAQENRTQMALLARQMGVRPL